MASRRRPDLRVQIVNSGKPGDTNPWLIVDVSDWPRGYPDPPYAWIGDQVIAYWPTREGAEDDARRLLAENRRHFAMP